MTSLVDGDELHTRVDQVRVSLAQRARKEVDDLDTRVVASTTHLGLVARVISPALAAIVVAGEPISLWLSDLWWRNHLGGPYPLSVAAGPGTELIESGCAVEAITHAVGQCYGVSYRVLWGNVGSAVSSAARLIADSRPELSAKVFDAANDVLADPRIDDGVLRAGPSFQRRSCCLLYSVTDDRRTVCGDCILR